MIQQPGFRFFADEIQHHVHRHASEQLAILLHYRCGNQIIAFESLGCVVSLVIGMQLDNIGQHNAPDNYFRLVDNDKIDREHTLEAVVAVYHEHLVGVVGQFVKTAQIA